MEKESERGFTMTNKAIKIIVVFEVDTETPREAANIVQSFLDTGMGDERIICCTEPTIFGGLP